MRRSNLRLLEGNFPLDFPSNGRLLRSVRSQRHHINSLAQKTKAEACPPLLPKKTLIRIHGVEMRLISFT
jgi:hypothetical protein